MNSLFGKLSIALVLIVVGMGSALFLVDRTFTAAYKRRILEEADGCTEPGELGALLR